MNIEIANRLVQLRKAHGLSQEELAAKLGLSRQAVSKWERAESSPDTDNLIMLSRLYGVSLDSLLATDEEIPMPDASDNKEEAEAEKKTGRDSVNISFREGINVTDDDGSHIHIGWDGIRMHDAGESANVDPADSVEVDDEGVTYTENGERIRAEWNSTGKDGSRRMLCVDTPWEDNKVSRIVVEDGVTSIGNFAFAFCPGLKEISLPETVTSIGDSVFDGSENLEVIYVAEGSFAEAYCINNELPYAVLSV